MIRNRKKWHNKVVSIMLAMLMVVSVVVQYPLNSIAENVQTGSEEYLGVQTEAKVYDDFENDIWLQYQQKEMQVGDTTNLRPWRVEQIISNAVAMTFRDRYFILRSSKTTAFRWIQKVPLKKQL